MITSVIILSLRPVRPMRPDAQDGKCIFRDVPAWFWRCGGQYCWKRVIPGGLPARNVVQDLLGCPVLSFVTVGRCLIGRPRNALGGGLLELLLCRSLNHPVLAPPTVHSP